MAILLCCNNSKRSQRRAILTVVVTYNILFILYQYPPPLPNVSLLDYYGDRFVWVHDSWFLANVTSYNPAVPGARKNINVHFSNNNTATNSASSSEVYSEVRTLYKKMILPFSSYYLSSSVSSSASSSTLPSKLSPLCQLRLPSFASHNDNQTTTMIRRIYFAHMRKAGGTTINWYLRKVAQHYGLQYKRMEGKPFNETLHDDHLRSDTFYVTHVRDPIQRMISHYEYDGRWPCSKLVEKNSTFLPTQNNSKSIVDWLYQFNASTQHRQHKHKEVLWYCTENCYTRWLALPHHLSSPHISSYDDLKRRAIQAAHRYHLILVLEWLQDPHYVKQLEAFFGVKGLQGRPKGMYCYKASKQANAITPAAYDSSIFQLLSERNAVDYSLLNELESCSKDGVQIPDDTTFQDLVIPNRAKHHATRNVENKIRRTKKRQKGKSATITPRMRRNRIRMGMFRRKRKQPNQ